MRRDIVSPIVGYSLRDLLRRPGRSLLLFTALAAMVFVVALPLLLQRGIELTAVSALEAGPSLVVRRITPSGFAPVTDAEESAAALRSVPGVNRVRPRLWGVVASDGRRFAVIGVDEVGRRELARLGVEAPASGRVVLGSRQGTFLRGGSLTLREQLSGESRTFRIASVLPESTDILLHDALLMDWTDAAAVIGVPEGGASDLGVWVRHSAEEAAIRPDLQRALPWMPSITTRTEASELAAAELGRAANIAIAAMAPALLLMALIVALGVGGRAERREVALLKVLGWTTRDVGWMRFVQAALLGIGGVSVGLALSMAVTYWPGASWLASLFFGRSAPTELFLDPSGAGLILATVAGLTLTPFFAASLWSAWRNAAADPGELLDE